MTTTRFGGERLGTWVTGSLVSLLASDLGAIGESLDQLISGVWEVGWLILSLGIAARNLLGSAHYCLGLHPIPAIC